MTLKEL